MALQSSGAISISNIAGEFGGSTPHSMSEYYRNGAYTTENNTNVPTSGAISISQFYGAQRKFASGYNSSYDSGGYRYLIFTSSGTLNCAALGLCDILLIGGGGAGGGTAWGGGGGAGEFRYIITGLDGSYGITIGAGGASQGQSGGTTYAFNSSAIGGGYGGWDVTLSSVQAPPDGYASGGGGAGSKYYPGTSQEGGIGVYTNGGNGYSGGSGVDAGGGGGGAGASGGHASSHYGGAGGAGKQWLDGTYYCGGGGGYGNGGWQAAGGSGYTNYGGGGQANSISAQNGAVIIRYAL